MQLYQRSADLFLGVPFNIASYSLLVLILAQIMGLEPGEFVHTFGDVHIYENHIPQVKEQLKRVPRPFPKVTIDKSVKSLKDFRPEHVTLEDYDPYPMMKAELTVAGGLYDKKTFGEFGHNIITSSHKLLELLLQCKRDGSRIVGVGAPARSNTLLNFSHIDSNILDYTCEKRGSPKIGSIPKKRFIASSARKSSRTKIIKIS